MRRLLGGLRRNDLGQFQASYSSELLILDVWVVEETSTAFSHFSMDFGDISKIGRDM